MPLPLLGMGIMAATTAAQHYLNKNENQTNSDRQLNANKEMADYNVKAQYDLWQKTGYSAQRKQMEDAGLNPALMYGMGGGGGQTVGSPGGSGVSQGQTSQPNLTGQATQLGLLDAQTKNIEAQTKAAEAQANKTNAEAENIGYTNKSITPEVIDAMSENIIANAAGERAKARSIELANNFETWMQNKDEITGESQKERQVRTEINKTISQIQEIDTLIGQSGVYQELLKASGKNYEADTELKQQLKQQLDKVNPVQLEQYITDLMTAKKQLEIMGTDPANTQIGQYINFTTKAIGDVVGAVSGISGIAKGIKGVKEAISTHSTNPQGGVTETHTTRRTR